MKLTRRQLAAAVSGAAIASAAAQTSQQPAPADELQTARERLKANVDALSQHDLPMATEPAFQFKV